MEFPEFLTGYFYKLCQKQGFLAYIKNTIELLLFTYNFVFINSTFIINIQGIKLITIMYDRLPFIL
jgi:hypothetical protein